MTKVCLFLGFFLVSGYWCRGQSGRSRAYGVSWSELEERIRNAAQLEGTDGKLAEIEDAARKAKDYISWTRSLFDRMMIRDRRTEDSSYFRNSAFIDSLLTADSIPRPMRLILHLMQAERVGGFVNRPLKFNGHTRRYIYRLARKHPHWSYSAIIADLDESISRSTIQRILRRYSLRKWKSKKRIHLTANDAQKRLRFCCEWANFDRWEDVIFSDECTVLRGSNSPAQIIFRFQDEALRPDLVNLGTRA